MIWFIYFCFRKLEIFISLILITQIILRSKKSYFCFTFIIKSIIRNMQKFKRNKRRIQLIFLFMILYYVEKPTQMLDGCLCQFCSFYKRGLTKSSFSRSIYFPSRKWICHFFHSSSKYINTLFFAQKIQHSVGRETCCSRDYFQHVNQWSRNQNKLYYIMD